MPFFLVRMENTTPLSTPDSRPVSALSLRISNICHAYGDVYIAVYDSEKNFLQPDKAVFVQVVPVRSKGALTVEVPLALPGHYAFSCYHDLNENGRLDTRLMGIPTEPYGFSNAARPKFRAPRWEEAKCYCTASAPSVELSLDTW